MTENIIHTDGIYLKLVRVGILITVDFGKYLYAHKKKCTPLLNLLNKE
jgi:hypothetical protein